MQLPRLRGGLRTRTPWGKARQIGEAVWIEMRHTKREILEAYLNLAPFGGTVQGVGAASQVYSQKSPDRLTVGEALTLAVIPQRPSTRAGRRGSDASLLRARDQLARAWLSRRAEKRSPIAGAPDGRVAGADVVNPAAQAERRQLELPIIARSTSGRPKRLLHFVDALSPLFFRIADSVNLARSTEAPPDPVPPSGVTRIAVCAESGDLPNADCPRTVDTWYLPGKSPIRVSQLHRAVGLDPRSGRPVCPPYAADTRIEVFEYWSSDMLKLFRRSGVPRRTPPALPDCAPAPAADAPRIASPLRGVGYGLRRSATNETIPLEASAAADVERLFWFDGNALIGSTAAAAGPLAWRPSRAGARTVRVVDDRGRSDARDVVVELGN